MTFPTLSVRISTTLPIDAPSWSDITARVHSFTTQRGRDSEFSPMGLGVASVTLDNHDRLFDPDYAAGTYYGALLPMQRISIRATWDGTTYGVFEGYLDGWPQNWRGGVDTDITIRACDGFKVLQMAEINGSFPEELSDVRIGHILGRTSWTLGATWALNSTTSSVLDTTTILAPNGEYTLEEGNANLQAQTLTATSALQHIHDVVNSEWGLLFIDGDGVIQFFKRYHAYSPVEAEFDDVGDPTEPIPPIQGYADLSYDLNDRMIYNDVRLGRIGGTLYTTEDITSEVTYLRRTLQDDRLLQAGEADIATLAAKKLARYKDPRVSNAMLTVSGYSNDNYMEQMLAREIGEIITVTRHPQGGAEITRNFRIEGIGHEVRRGLSWTTRYNLSTFVTVSP